MTPMPAFPLTPPRDDPEFQALLAYSAALGRDRFSIQGPGGNTSLKRGEVLWVKASGTMLADAESRPIMIPLALAPLRRAVAEADPRAESALAFVLPHTGPSLRPSVEATLHAVLPHPVVIHLHCVETIAWAVRRDAEAALAPRLHGLAWHFVPYVRPGPPLTRALLELAGAHPGNVIVLGHHGLVVGAESVAEAQYLIAEVKARLARPPRLPPASDPAPLARRAASTPYRPAPEAAQGLAFDPASLAVARLGSFYPDHVVFLGPGLTLARSADLAAQTAPMVVVPEEGVFIRRDAPPAVEALTLALADVAARLHPDEPLVPLDPAAEAELLGWEAEHYRRRLAEAEEK
jgi:rhamnose utilization protein RhaD (predicted bifunctional aldolase and dehydrogenase)